MADDFISGMDVKLSAFFDADMVIRDLNAMCAAATRTDGKLVVLGLAANGRLQDLPDLQCSKAKIECAV